MRHFVPHFSARHIVRRRSSKASVDHSPQLIHVESLENRMLLAAGDLIHGVPIDFLAAENDYFNDVAVQADGKIVAVGLAHFSGDDDFLIARFNANGTLDTTFSGDGWLTYHFAGRNDEAIAVAIQANGKIVVGGKTTPVGGTNIDFGIIRLMPNGSVDNTFNSSGRVLFDFPDSAVLEGVAVSDTNRIVFGGSYLSGTQSILMRCTSTGALDPSFDADGIKYIGQYMVDLGLDPAERIVAVSSTGTITRLRPDGAYDATFSGDGVATAELVPGFSNYIRALAFGPSGEIVLAGHYLDGTYLTPAVARLLPNGGYDPSFNGIGRVSFDVTASANDMLEDVVVLPNGTIVAAGNNAALNPDWIVVQLTPRGALDTAFSGDGLRTFDAGGRDFGRALAVTPRGDYVVVGRILTTGTDDSSYLGIFEGTPVAEDLVGYHAGTWRVAQSRRILFQSADFATWANVAWDALRHGDFNGDGRTDVLGFIDGAWWVGIGSETAFTTSRWSVWSPLNWENVAIGDINHDGRDDVLARYGGQWWAALSTGTAFAVPTRWATWSNLPWNNVSLTDLNGDGRADLLGRYAGTWWAGLSTGAAFALPSLWATWSDISWVTLATFDANGDGLTDIAGFIDGQWWIGVSTGHGFETDRWGSWANVIWRDPRIGDFDGDGRDDVIARYGGTWWVGRSTGSSLSTSLFATWSDIDWQNVTVGDFNGDGRDDIAGRALAQWWVAVSSGSASTTSLWGSWSDSAWQAVAAAEITRSTYLTMMMFAPPAAPGVGDALSTLSSDDEQTSLLWSMTDDDELAALALAD